MDLRGSGQHLVPLIAATHAGLLKWQYVPELYVCDNISMPQVHTSDDIFTAIDRQSRSAEYSIVSVLELVVMFLVSYVCKGGQGMNKQLLQGGYRYLPLILVVSTLAIRLRHIGLFGCVDGDPYCCGNLQCPDSMYTANLPGCSMQSDKQDQGFVAISWAYRNSFCPLPGWYGLPSNYNVNLDIQSRNVQTYVARWCGGLYGTPDVASCYRYGCSSKATPIPYYGIRMVVANVILFVLLSLLAPSGLPYRRYTSEQSKR